MRLLCVLCRMRTLIDMAADRGAFIDQSQSLNLFMAAPTTQKLTSMHFYSWKRGLKTGCYYLRTRPAADAIQFTVSSGNSAFESFMLKLSCDRKTVFPLVCIEPSVNIRLNVAHVISGR